MVRISERAQQSIAVSLVLGIISLAIVNTALTPSQPEQFFELYILGEGGETEGYFPNDNPNVTQGTLIQWRLGVRNLMAQTEYISLRIKLGNRTLTQPDRISCTASSLPTLLEYRWILAQNKTYQKDFTWSIINIINNGQTRMLELLIDGEYIKSPVEAVDGLNFRIIFELWALDPNTGAFDFGWTLRSEKSCVWTQIWFNATSN